MLLRVSLAAVVAVGLGLLLRRRLGALTAWSVAAFVFSLSCLAILTLTPAYQVPDVVPAEERPDACSWDYGGPSPEGFWILGGGQRLLNLAVFVPAGAFLVLAVARWRAAWVLAPLGLLGLVGFSVAIELVQLELDRIDRACDVTDVVDNATGAGLGFLVGLGLALVLRPWSRRRH
jgi:glycopeptide antibiotics resistance protein